MPHPSLAHLDHRPWTIPSRPWTWRQVWHDLLFLHWRVPAATLRPLVPAGLELDLFEGDAWLAVTPFWMSGVTLRGAPAIPGLSSFPELNVRTYVRWKDRPGVWFLSLDAANPVAVRAARLLYRLPYMDARMTVRRMEGRTHYHSRRSSGIRFEAEYQPVSPVQLAEPGTLEHWLTERYCLYAVDQGRLLRAEIHHEPWPLQPARARIIHSDMLRVHGIQAEGPPASTLFAARLAVVIWSPEPVDLK